MEYHGYSWIYWRELNLTIVNEPKLAIAALKNIDGLNSKFGGSVQDHRTFLFRPIQTPLHCSCQLYRFCSLCTQVIGCGLSTCIKRKAVHRLESIVLYCYGLLNCSGAGSQLPLFNFERVLWSRLDWVWSLLLTINRSRIANRLWSPPDAIAWIERCFFWLSYALEASFLC